MDGIATIATGLFLVIALNYALTSRSEHRRSEVEMLTVDLQTVMDCLRTFHECIQELRGPDQTQDHWLSDKDHRELLRLSRSYSNALHLVTHTITLSRPDSNSLTALEICKADFVAYRELIIGESFPMRVDAVSFRAEPSLYLRAQRNLRTLLYKLVQQ
jgi:hypothetical protein